MNSVPDLQRSRERQNKDPHLSRTCSTLAETTRETQNCNLTSQKKKAKNKHWRSNSDRRVKKNTADRFNTCQTHQRVDVLNTDHTDVAVFRLQVSRGEHHGVFPFWNTKYGMVSVSNFPLVRSSCVFCGTGTCPTKCSKMPSVQYFEHNEHVIWREITPFPHWESSSLILH